MPRTTPGSVAWLAREGYGVDDIRVRTGWSYRAIAAALGREARLAPWCRLALQRAKAA